ncbi:VOC family protein [Streptosporangium sp. NPDC006007]|uniref:VOC family protein n=1 Tax=Streptosporangium sp. NPDC006007 TaxID=3154575 RepID=UPI0033A51497
MAARFQLTFDCADPDRQARFWAEALGYRLEDPPAGFDDWDAYWRSVGVPEEELGVGVDSIVDPDGTGPRIWFQKVSEGKAVKNRIHVDLHASGGRDFPLETRKERVDAEVARLVALGATRRRTLTEPGVDHYAVAMSDPEGNEFDVVN